MILIVDDSTTNQVLLEAILQEEGYETVTAFSAKEAFKLVEKHKPKLILLDLLMPEVSGFDFLRQLKGNKNTSNTPVIVVSAVESRENVDTCMQYGAADFIGKPIDIALFLGKVKQTMLT